MATGEKGRKKALVGIGVALAVVLTAALVYFYRSVPVDRDRDYMKLFREALGEVRENYVEKPDDTKLIKGAIDGMLAALDPHSAYLPPEPYAEMKVEMSGSFGGLGIEISMKEGKLTVIAPIEGTPADRAGIRAGDQIIRIDATSTQGLNIAEAVKKMRGKPGTKVTLTILREKEDRPLAFPLERAVIQMKSMKGKTLEPSYGYIRIGHFQERTGDEFVKVLEKLRKENNGSLKGLVLDLRNNPGGLLEAAVNVASRFVGEGFEDGLIVYTEGREHFAKRRLSATIGEKEPRYPLVVLINGGSASASEIVAGALQDHHRAVIMGTRSFGKGSVQAVMPLRNGGALKLTTARYFTPSGRSIQAKGIEPDIIVGNVDYKPVSADKAKGIHEMDLDNHLTTPGEEQKPSPEQAPPPSGSSAHGGGVEAKDYQLLRALELLKGYETMRKIAGTGR